MIQFIDTPINITESDTTISNLILNTFDKKENQVLFTAEDKEKFYHIALLFTLNEYLKHTETEDILFSRKSVSKYLSASDFRLVHTKPSFIQELSYNNVRYYYDTYTLLSIVYQTIIIRVNDLYANKVSTIEEKIIRKQLQIEQLEKELSLLKNQKQLKNDLTNTIYKLLNNN